MPVDVKICGLSTPEAVRAAARGATLSRVRVFPAVPRFGRPAVAAELGGYAPGSVIRVGLTVDADDSTLAEIAAQARVGRLQLHGRETPERVAEVRRRFDLPVIKALPIAGPEDVTAARAYEEVADMLLFDARPPAGADRPGGNALAFDWGLLTGTTCAGGCGRGLPAANLPMRAPPRARPVESRSGVETAGVKNVLKIRNS
jgi:phosphoribosylanthranilate isomerase